MGPIDDDLAASSALPVSGETLEEQYSSRLRLLATELEKPGCNVWLGPAAAKMLRELADALAAPEGQEPQ